MRANRLDHPLLGAALLLAAGVLLAPAPGAAVNRRGFVTSVTGTGNLASWAGATGATALDKGDSICRARATAATLPNPTTYRAWLSTSTTDAYCHVQGLTGKKATGCGGGVQPGAGPWYLSNGITPFSGSLAELTVKARTPGFEHLLEWARALDQDRLFAVEDGRHVSGHLERHLIARGER